MSLSDELLSVAGRLAPDSETQLKQSPESPGRFSYQYFTKHGQEGVSSRPMTGTSADAAPYWAEARHALGRADPILGKLIRAAGGSVLRPRNDPFFSLSRSIVAQQISVHAAEAVWQKLIAHVGAMTPGAVASQTEDALHGCGLSRPKARYLLSLAEPSCPKTQTRCQALDGCALHNNDR